MNITDPAIALFLMGLVAGTLFGLWLSAVVLERDPLWRKYVYEKKKQKKEG